MAVLIVVVAFLYKAQAEEQKWKRTVTLPNGDVVLDISGEWDSLVQWYGTWAGAFGGTWEHKVKITQEGSSFVGTRMMDEGQRLKGSELLRGEVHKGGLKNVYIVGYVGNLMTGTQITEGGDKIEIDSWDKVRVVLRRPKERVAAVPAGPKPEVTERIKLRDKAEKNFSDADLQKMIKERNFFNKKSNPEENFPNNLVDNGNGTVTDRVTGLVWQKGGSPSDMRFDAVTKYVDDLNASRFGGYSDWRLPTMEELYSLMEETPNQSEKFMDNLFEPAQGVCWSSDANPKYRPEGPGVTVYVVFGVNFARGETTAGVSDRFALASISQGSFYVKAVGTAQ